MQYIFTGPESSGKTTLAKQLGDTLQCSLILEYAREYLEQLPNAKNYTLADVEQIALLQHKQQIDAYANANVVIYDTDALVCDIWIRERFGVQSEITTQIISEYNHIDRHYFLCKPDLRWQYDKLREHSAASERQRLFDIQQEMLQNLGFEYSVIEGQGDVRYKQLTKAIKPTIN